MLFAQIHHSQFRDHKRLGRIRGRRLSTLLQDLRFGVRMLTKNLGFTAVTLLTLALGIGANTAIFSLVNAIILRPLPYPDSDRVVTIWVTEPSGPGNLYPDTGPDFVDWKAQNKVFDIMGAVINSVRELGAVRKS
jgi:putative ABC transport system permease protein